LDFILEAHKLDDEYEGQETKKKEKKIMECMMKTIEIFYTT
jgi:hypothetical protein